MGIFKVNKKKGKSDNEVKGKNRSELLYKRKKGSRIIKKSNQFPIITSMKLSKIRPTAVIDYIANNRNGLLNSVEGKFDKKVDDQKGYLVIALAESDLKDMFSRGDKESFGLLVNAINKDMIKSATLPLSMNDGYLVLVPSDETIELLGDHEEVVEYEKGFYWGIFPDSISDSEVDAKRVYILNDRVRYEALSKLSKESPTNSKITLEHIQYDSKGNIESASILINNQTIPGNEQTDSQDLESHKESGNQEVSENIEDDFYNTSEENLTNEESGEEVIDISVESFDQELAKQNVLREKEAIEVNDGVNNVLEESSDTHSDNEMDEVDNSVGNQTDEIEETDDLSTTDATQMVDFVKEKIKTFDRTPTDLGVQLSLEDISYLFMSGEVPVLTLTTEKNDNELEKVLNSKRLLANDKLKKVHLDSVQKILDTYMEKSNEAIIKIREATNLDDPDNKLGRRKQILDEKYGVEKNEISSKVEQYSKAVWDEYDVRKRQVIDSAVAQAKMNFDRDNRITAEQKIKRKEQELNAICDSSFENEVARLKSDRLEEVKRLFEMINSDTISRLKSMYHKFQETEKEMALQYQQEIERFSDKYWENELERQKTVQRKLDNDTTIDELQSKLDNLEATKTHIVSENEHAMEELVVNNKRRIKAITEQFEEEDNRRRNEFIEKEKYYTDEISKQNKKIIELQKEYEELKRNSQDELSMFKKESQEEQIRYMREAEDQIREEKDRMRQESREREALYTEKFKQKDIETRRAVKSTKLIAVIGMIAAMLFGISIPIVGERVWSEYSIQKNTATNTSSSERSAVESTHQEITKNQNESSHSSSNSEKSQTTDSSNLNSNNNNQNNDQSVESNVIVTKESK